MRCPLFRRTLPLLTLLLPASLFAVEVSPIFNARLYGGQYFFESQESNLSGNFALTAAPAVAFNQRWSLIPTISTSWRGTKSVQDLVGGGTLFQQTQDHAASVKAIYAPNKLWQYKAGGGYRIQLLKETSDENWGKGLFDFQKPSGNFEVERALGKDGGVRLGYDYYLIDFRNFSSLESQNRDLGRENASAKTLNTANHAGYLSVRHPFPFIQEQRGRLELSYYYTMRNFDEQKIVVLSGDLSGDLRKDKSHIATANFTFPFAFSERFKMLAELRGSYNLLQSNQNNYDARKTRFNPNFYSYREFSTGPGFTLLLGPQPWIFNSGFTYARREYDARPVQDDGGAYGAANIHTNEYYASFSLGYPISKNFTVQAIGNLAWSRSNMKYEKTYRYNYVTSTYLFGVVYDY